MAGQTRLIRTHGPATVLLVRGDCYQPSIGREGAGPAFLQPRHDSFGARRSLDGLVDVVVSLGEEIEVSHAMPVFGVRLAWCRKQEDGRANCGLNIRELHGDGWICALPDTAVFVRAVVSDTS